MKRIAERIVKQTVTEITEIEIWNYLRETTSETSEAMSDWAKLLDENIVSLSDMTLEESVAVVNAANAWIDKHVMHSEGPFGDVFLDAGPDDNDGSLCWTMQAEEVIGYKRIDG